MKDGMSEDNVTGDHVSIPKPSNKSKVSKETWLRIQADYESSNYKSLAELASRYGIEDGALEMRVSRGKWYERQRALRCKALDKVGEIAQSKLIDKVETYLDKSLKRAEKYERMIDASQEFNGSKTAEGLPLLSPDDLDVYSRTELRIAELSRIALKIVDTKQVEHSGGIAIFNVTEAIKALRAQPPPDLTNEELARLKDCRIEGEDPPSP